LIVNDLQRLAQGLFPGEAVSAMHRSWRRWTLDYLEMSPVHWRLKLVGPLGLGSSTRFDAEFNPELNKNSSA